MNNNNNMNLKKKKSYLTGIDIIKVAAFAFAIVSWYATASGLSMYVFGPGWQSGLISFGIQTILFVFNLKLPFYFNHIGENSPNRAKKKYYFGPNKGNEKSTYKITGLQYVIAGFYIVVLLNSSFFSFIYICNYVVYEHQSGYADDNTILAFTYRDILNDTNNYIKEDTKAMQILASKLLGELKSKYPINATANNSVSLQELNDKLAEAEDLFAIAEENYYTAKSEADRLEEEKENYAKIRNSTIYHNRQDEWELKYNEARENYDNAVIVRDSKNTDYVNARQNLTAAKNAVTNYKESQDTIIAKFLLEMLDPSPSPESLELYINEINDMVVNLGENVDIIDNYSELVETTQTLTIVVEDYISLVNAANDGSENSIKYLMEHIMDYTISPDPKSESFDSDYSKWRKDWETKLNTLENVIQHLPKFSESEKVNLKNTLIDVDLLSSYKSNDKMYVIDELRRNKVSDINVIEKASSLLFGKYRFTAWFSFALALFFDLSSLLAGLFIYGIQKKTSSTPTL